MKASGKSAFPTTIDFTTPNITLTFPTPVTLKGIPQYRTNTGKVPASATIVSGRTVVVLVYDTPGAVTSITVPDGDTSINSDTGGSVPAGTFPAA